MMTHAIQDDRNVGTTPIYSTRAQVTRAPLHASPRRHIHHAAERDSVPSTIMIRNFCYLVRKNLVYSAFADIAIFFSGHPATTHTKMIFNGLGSASSCSAILSSDNYIPRHFVVRHKRMRC